jgi:hypothetical protein
MCGWAKGGRVKWDEASSAVAGAVGVGVFVVDKGVSDDGVSLSALEVASTASSPFDETSASLASADSVSVASTIGATFAFGCCSIGIARQSTVNISPGFSSVFGLRTCPSDSLSKLWKNSPQRHST